MGHPLRKCVVSGIGTFFTFVRASCSDTHTHTPMSVRSIEGGLGTVVCRATQHFSKPCFSMWPDMFIAVPVLKSWHGDGGRGCLKLGGWWQVGNVCEGKT